MATSRNDAPPLAVLVIQVKQVQSQIEALRHAARRHGLIYDPDNHRFDNTEAGCLAVEQLMGDVWAGFHHAANAERRARGEPQMRPFTTITEVDRKQAADAAGRG